MANPIRLLPHSCQILCVLIGGVLIHLTLGTVYTVGNLNPYLISYFRSNVPGSDDLNYNVMSWMFGITIFGQTSCVTFGGMMERKFGPRLTALVGCLIMSFGVLITYFSIQQSLILCLFTYGLIVGIGTGITYNAPLVCAMKWLPDHHGLASGLIVAGFGLGAFVFNQVQTAYVNPWNYVPDESGFFTQQELLSRVPTLFFVLSAIYVCMQILGSLLLIDPPENNVNWSQDEEKPLLQNQPRNGHDIGGSSIPAGGDDNLPPREVLKSSTFWCLWWTMLMNGQVINFMSSYFKVFGQTFIHNDYMLAVVGSASSVCNMAGRVAWGYLGDRFSYQGCMTCVTALLTVWMLTIYATSQMGEIAYFIWICATFLTFSGQFSLLPMATARAFGARNVGVNYGLVFTSAAVTALLNATITTLLLDRLGFVGMFLLMAAAGFLSFCVTMIIHSSDYGSRIGIRR